MESDFSANQKRVVRMRKNKNTPYPMILINAERYEEGKRALDVKDVCGLRVQVESKRSQSVEFNDCDARD